MTFFEYYKRSIYFKLSIFVISELPFLVHLMLLFTCCHVPGRVADRCKFLRLWYPAIPSSIECRFSELWIFTFIYSTLKKTVHRERELFGILFTFYEPLQVRSTHVYVIFVTERTTNLRGGDVYGGKNINIGAHEELLWVQLD